jgi:hypothetical protein
MASSNHLDAAARASTAARPRATLDAATHTASASARRSTRARPRAIRARDDLCRRRRAVPHSSSRRATTATLESRSNRARTKREATARAIVDARGRADARTRRDGDVPVDREVFLGEMRASRRVARGARRARARATGRTRDRASMRGGARDGGRERRER